MAGPPRKDSDSPAGSPPDSPADNAAPDPLQVLLQASAAAEAVQQQINELKTRRAELIAERDQLSADRSAFETRAREFAHQVAQDRTSQRELTAELEQQKALQKQQQAELDQEKESLQRSREELEKRQERLHDVVDAEMAREREILQRQQKSLDEERSRLADRSDEFERQHADRLRQVEATLQTEREQMRESVRGELSEELDDVHRERQEWTRQKEKESHELQQQSEDLQQQRELFGQQLDSEHQRLKAEIEKRQQILLSEQNNLQRRYRFQFEHLARAREDFEVELRELRREQQVFRRERSDFQEQHRLQFTQLQRIRTALMQRDASLAREQKVVDRLRIGTELDLKRQRDRLTEYEASVVQDLESRHRQLRQSEQASSESSQRIEQRRQHVNVLRAELDAKQQEILEQRLLLEELQGQLSDKTAAENGRHVQAKKAVESFFQQLHDRLQSERDRLRTQATELAERQEQFRMDRVSLEEWFAAQERRIAEDSASGAPVDVEQTEQLQQELSDVRSKWNRERRESEATIRALLDQVAELESENFGRQKIVATDDSVDQRSAA